LIRQAEFSSTRCRSPVLHYQSWRSCSRMRESCSRFEIRGTSYRIGQPGDLAYFVPCLDNQRVVLLRPSTGDLFIFDHLAEAGAPRTAQSAGRVAGAIEIVPSADETCSEFGVVTEHALVRIPVPTSTRKTQ